MTSEEMQQAMEFLIQQQAQSSAKIDALAERRKVLMKDGRGPRKDGRELKKAFAPCFLALKYTSEKSRW